MTSFTVTDELEALESETEDTESNEPLIDISAQAFETIEDTIKSILKNLVTTTTDKCAEPHARVVRRPELRHLVNKLLSAQMEDRHFNSLVNLVSQRNPGVKVTITAATALSYVYPAVALLIIKEAMENPELVTQAIQAADKAQAASDEQRFSKLNLLIASHFGETEDSEDEDIFALNVA